MIITGPVGAGKSTTALALAQALRRPERAVAVLDLDQLYGFVRQQEGYGEPLGWERARLGAAALAQAWLGADVAAVIVEGEFFNQAQLDAIVATLPAQVARCFCTLRITYETALVRVQGDPTRGASRDPAFLRWLHDDFARALPFLAAASTVIDTDALAQDEVVARLLVLIRERTGAAAGGGVGADRAT